MRFRDIVPFTSCGNYTVDVPLKSVPDTLEHYRTETGLDLDPDFQRGHVWTDEQRSRYVEFLLRDGRSARIIYFNSPGWMRRHCEMVTLVDGKQRLEAVTKFLNNEISIFDKYFFRDFTDRIDTLNGLKFCINNLETRKEVLQWYLDLNTGGVVHTAKEIAKVRKLLEAEK